jgi:hypothetical protein
MLPLRDKNPTHRTPVVNIVLIVANIAAFLYEISLGANLERFFLQYGLVPRFFLESLQSFQIVNGSIVPLFTSIFLHGGWLHLGGNMLYLWIFGDNVEDKLGHGRYFIFYIACGVVASLSHIALDPSSAVPTVGASGAISGVLAGYLIMFPKAKIVTVIPIFVFLQVAELPALVVLGFWFVIQFFNGLLSLGYHTAGMGGVAWWAHVGGFIAGLILVIPFRKFQ